MSLPLVLPEDTRDRLNTLGGGVGDVLDDLLFQGGLGQASDTEDLQEPADDDKPQCVKTEGCDEDCTATCAQADREEADRAASNEAAASENAAASGEAG